MKSRLLFLIILVLTFVRGQGSGIGSNASFTSQSTEQFSAFVGQTVNRSIEIQFKSGDIIPNPDPPDVPMITSGSSNQSIEAELIDLSYMVSVEGEDSAMFTAKVIKKSATSNACTVKITYMPTSVGVHHAYVTVTCTKLSVLKSPVTINLIGEASVLKGDANGDGKVDISDVTNLIDVILNGGEAPGGDVNGDGKVDISDVTNLIDLILNGPSVMYYPTLLVTTTDGVTVEYLIDENTKLKIQKPDLIIETGGMVLNYSLEKMAHLRYGQREVSSRSILQNFTIPRAGDVYIHGSQDNNAAKVICANDTIIKEATNDGSIAVSLGSAPSGEYEIKAESQTIKVLKP